MLRRVAYLTALIAVCNLNVACGDEEIKPNPNNQISQQPYNSNPSNGNFDSTANANGDSFLNDTTPTTYPTTTDTTGTAGSALGFDPSGLPSDLGSLAGLLGGGGSGGASGGGLLGGDSGGGGIFSKFMGFFSNMGGGSGLGDMFGG